MVLPFVIRLGNLIIFSRGSGIETDGDRNRSFLLAALTGFLVWRAADRFWHFLAIIALGAAMFPLAAHGPAGDVSRYLPSGLFSNGPDGKDQIVLVSAAATVLISTVLTAGLWTAVITIWRRMRTSSDKPGN